MLRRLYIDNYKSLVNFDLELGRTHLLLGRNGSGKTTVFKVLSGLKAFLSDETATPLLFAPRTCTRWDKRTRQTFELDVALGAEGGTYCYRLELESATGVPLVAHESLRLAKRTLFHREGDSVHLFRADGTAKPGEFLIRERSSLLPHLTGRHGSVELSAFRSWFERAHILSIDPSGFGSISGADDPLLVDSLENFASWYRHLAQEQPGSVRALEEDLRQVLGPEFQNLKLTRTGDETTRRLRTEWRVDSERPDSRFELDFDELSDGQRVLICLYTLLHADAGEPTLLCVDEPDNFVALSEIQPWLMALAERPNIQSLLISHHPEIINLGAQDALYFYRRGQGPTRVKKFKELVHAEETLTAAELIARGWVDADS